MEIIRLAFFDVDGVLSAPEYRDQGEAVIGFTEEGWQHWCEEEEEAGYRYCKPLPPVRTFAEERKKDGSRLFVLTATAGELETKAKEVFVREHYPALFEAVIPVSHENRFRRSRFLLRRGEREEGAGRKGHHGLCGEPLLLRLVS